MTTQIIVLAALLLSTLLMMFVLNYVLNTRIKGKMASNEVPTAVELLRVVFFLSGGILVYNVASSYQTILSVLPTSYSGNDLTIHQISYFSILLALTMIICLVLIWLANLMYSLISKGKNIFIEVSNNNVNASILFCGILLALTIPSIAGLSGVLESVIPYPELPIYR